jgi:MFS family permease
MLFIGTIAGVIGEALNRKRLLVTQLLVMGLSSAILCALAFSEQIRVWHIAVGGMVAGIVWAMELAVRRRMLGEVVTPDQVAPAVAFDSLTNSFARVLGPLAGGAAYQTLGWAVPIFCQQPSILRPVLPSAASISVRSRGSCDLAELPST